MSAPVSCIVGRNGSQNSFWRRLENDYNLNSIQILPVLDNEIGSDVVRLLKEHHNIFDAAVVFLIVNSEFEGFPENEKHNVRKMWTSDKKLIFSIPTGILMQFLRKIQNREKRDYSNRILNRRFDTFLSIATGAKKKKKKRKKKRR